MSSISNDFCRQMGDIDANFKHIAKKFPLEHLKSYKISESGEFELVFDQKTNGRALHKEDDFKKLVANVTVNVKAVVTGKIDKDKKIIRIKSGCLRATKTKFPLSATVSLVEVEVKDGKIKLTAEKCRFRCSKELAPKAIRGAKILWA